MLDKKLLLEVLNAVKYPLTALRTSRSNFLSNIMVKFKWLAYSVTV